MARLGPAAASLLAMMLLLAGFAPHAAAGQPGPVCRVGSVIDVMTRELRRRDPYVRIRPQWIMEYPSTRPDVVLCGVTAQTWRYDASRSATVPLSYIVRHGFRVRAVLDGYVVTFVQ